jgi:HAD superfamily hydrolase (TIGR01509 family)
VKIPPGKFSAYLFDCDGTISDSMPLHYEAWQKALKLYGSTLPLELHYEWAGRPTEKIVALLNEKFGLSMPPAEVSHKREEFFLELLPTVKAIAEVEECIRRDHGKIPFAVVSGSPRKSINETLGYLNLSKYFDVIVGAEDYKKGKPDPEPFLVAAAKLGVKAEDCLVFEDAELGIQSAIAAGMKWIKVPSEK